MQDEGPRLRELTAEETRETQLKVLHRFHSYCDDHGLTYYLCAGTLLGAVRHRGFIPWDDDIDVMMPRPHYERLVNLTATTPVAGVRFHSFASDHSHSVPFMKVSDPQTLLIEDVRLPARVGVNIDVFPVDAWAAGTAGVLQRRLLVALRRLLGLKKTRLRPERRLPRNLVLVLARSVAAPLGNRRLAIWMDSLAKAGMRRPSEWAGVLVWGYHERVPARAYGEPAPLEFEGGMFPGPADPELVLSVVYGDFRELPPGDQRRSHHVYRAYRLLDAGPTTRCRPGE